MNTVEDNGAEEARKSTLEVLMNAKTEIEHLSASLHIAQAQLRIVDIFATAIGRAGGSVAAQGMGGPTTLWDLQRKINEYESKRVK